MTRVHAERIAERTGLNWQSVRRIVTGGGGRPENRLKIEAAARDLGIDLQPPPTRHGRRRGEPTGGDRGHLDAIPSGWVSSVNRACTRWLRGRGLIATDIKRR